MSTLSIYIVEDEPLYANQLEMMIDKLDYELAGMSDNSDVALKEIDEKKPDLVLLDVKINGSMNGIDLANAISQPTPTIFITSFGDEATYNRAKEANPYAYITKPFDELNLQRTIELALSKLALANNNVPAPNQEHEQDLMVINDAVFMKVGRKIDKVNIDDILYCEVDNNYTSIFTNADKKYVVRLNLDRLNEQLPQNFLKRIHRKYSIHLKNITSIDLSELSVTVGNKELPIGRSHKDGLLEVIRLLK